MDAFQLSLQAAEGYESKFVPAIFGEWAAYLVEAAGVVPGQAVLDVACGTGIVSRAAADRLGGRGRVVGVDLNEGMLTVARRLRGDVAWRQGDAAALPFSDAEFDVVLCQAALMFLPDRVTALREMRRVVKQAGTVAVQVWGSLGAQRGYAPFYEVVARHAGPQAVDALGGYWVLGDLAATTRLVGSAGLDVTATRTRVGSAKFDSVDDFVAVEIKGTPVGAAIDDAAYERILADTRVALASFRRASGTLVLPIEGHLITARRA
jgi:SAM-dependent methyltransferase